MSFRYTEFCKKRLGQRIGQNSKAEFIKYSCNIIKRMTRAFHDKKEKNICIPEISDFTFYLKTAEYKTDTKKFQNANEYRKDKKKQ